MSICKWCDSGKEVGEGCFRCDDCAREAIMNHNELNRPIPGQTLWKNRNGNYIPKPSH